MWKLAVFFYQDPYSHSRVLNPVPINTVNKLLSIKLLFSSILCKECKIIPGGAEKVITLY